MELKTFEDEKLLRLYQDARDAPRAVMAYGVYSNCVKALADYDALVARLQTDLVGFTDYHNEVTKTVAPYIAQLQQYMAGIVTIMQAIEQAAPGTFGIEVPSNE